MADTALVTEELVQQENTPQDTSISGQLANSFWGNQPTETPTAVAETVTPTVVAPVVETPKIEEAPKEEVFDEAVYIKNNYGYESPEALKQAIEDSKKPREEIKFENDESKTLFELVRQGKKKEVREILDRQEKLEQYTSTEVNAQTAESIIKLGMELSNKLLTKEDIDFKYRQEYGVPKEPIQKASETDEDFAERMELWNERKITAEMKKIVDAKMAVPQLEQLKQKIVFPEIESKPVETVRQPTQEELDKAKKYNDAYVQSVDASLKDFNGFSVKVKNEDIGLPEIEISYPLIDVERNVLSQQMKDFVNTNYDANALFANEWVNDDGTLNTRKMSEDRYLLKNRDKIIQKVAQDSATKAIEAFVKGKKNINLKETQTTMTEGLTNEKTEMDILREKVFG